ncbi:MAG: hypothetical protein ACFB02_10620 [Mastigocoleus sp.]
MITTRVSSDRLVTGLKQNQANSVITRDRTYVSLHYVTVASDKSSLRKS